MFEKYYVETDLSGSKESKNGLNGSKWVKKSKKGQKKG